MSTARIALNVGATYTQTAVSVVVGLLSSRWVYLALGKVDFGLFALVGAIIGFITFLNSTMVSSNARFFAVAIGESKRGSSQEKDLLCKWFNTALSVHSILPVALVIAGYPVGVYFIRHVLSIPAESIESCIWVFRFSLLAILTTMVTVPFNALYTAKQFIFVRNLFGILQTLAWAAEGWWLLHYDGNRLIAHAAVLMVLITVLNAAIAGLAMHAFPECKIKRAYWFDRARLKELFSFSAFSMLGSLGSLFSNSGVSMVVNVFFGPTMNAAMGVGVQISAKVSMLAAAINSAVSPEVAMRVGKHDMDRAGRLGVRVCFYSVALPLVVLMPIILYIEEILILWLKSPPEYAAEITVILLVASMILNQTCGFRMLIDAMGRVKAYQLSTSTLNLSCLVIVWLMLEFGFGIVWALTVGWLIPKTLIAVVSVLLAKRLAGIPLHRAVSQVVAPLALIGGISWLICAVIYTQTPSTWLGFLLALACNAVVVIALFWALLTQEERSAFRGLVNKTLTKLGIHRASRQRAG